MNIFISHLITTLKYFFYFLCPFHSFIFLQGSLSKAFGFNTTKSKRNDKSLGNSTSPTPSYSSLSSENGLYATVGIIPPPLPCNGPPTHLPHNQNYQHSAYAMAGGSIAGISGSNSPPPLPSHRVSAPPMDTNSTLPRYAQHRRVKSISDIEALAGTPQQINGGSFAKFNKLCNDRFDRRMINNSV